MELLLLKLVGFFRPLASMSFAEDVFQIVGVALFGVLVFLFLWSSASRRAIAFSAVDVALVVFSLWSVSVFLIYFEKARVSELAKMLVPVLSYIVVKNVIRDQEQYRKLLLWIIVGFFLPIIASVVLIATGKGIDYVSYWTGIQRWEGAYTGAHSMGHSMTLFLMVLALYLRLSVANGSAAVSANGFAVRVTLGLFAGLATYCLYMSQVRSAILGLLVFSVVYLMFFNRRALLIGGAGLVTIAIIMLPYWVPVLLPDVWLVEHGRADASAIGSGRQTFWRQNLELFADLPIDRQLAGVGIGNRDSFSEEGVLDSHNDWLDVMMQTGIIGVLLMLLIQFLVLRAILRFPGREKYAYLALFLAVNVMMLVSNSYVWRIQVGHLYYIVLAFIELKHPLPLRDGQAGIRDTSASGGTRSYSS
jgi:hypothetical protein